MVKRKRVSGQHVSRASGFRVASCRPHALLCSDRCRRLPSVHIHERPAALLPYRVPGFPQPLSQVLLTSLRSSLASVNRPILHLCGPPRTSRAHCSHTLACSGTVFLSIHCLHRLMFGVASDTTMSSLYFIPPHDGISSFMMGGSRLYWQTVDR